MEQLGVVVGQGVADILDHSAKHLIPGLRVSRNSEE